MKKIYALNKGNLSDYCAILRGKTSAKSYSDASNYRFLTQFTETAVYKNQS